MAAVLTVQLAGCGHSGQGTGTGSGNGSSSGGSGAAAQGNPSAEGGDYNAVYTVKELPLEQELITGVSGLNFRKMRLCGDRLYALTTSYGDFGTVEQILSFNRDGSGVEMGDILSIADGEYIDSAFDENGRLYVLRLGKGAAEEYYPGSAPSSQEPEETFEEGPAGPVEEDDSAWEEEHDGPDLAAAEQEAEEEEQLGGEEASGPDLEGSVEVVDGPGAAPSETYTAEEVEEVDFGENGSADESTEYYSVYCYDPDGSIVWEEAIQGEGELYYAGQIICVPDGLVISDSNGLSLMSRDDGSIKGTVARDSSLAGCSIYGLEDGRIAVWSYGDSGQEIRVFTSSGEEAGTYPVTGNAQFITMLPGSSYALYLFSERGIYGMNLDGKEPVKVLDYLDSDLDILSVDALVELEPGCFAAALIDTDGDTEVCLLNKVDPETAANRTILTLGCYYIDYEVRKQVLAYNKTSENTRIRILDYSDYDTSTGSEGLTRLNADIASGNAPDIILLSYAMPLRSYVAKGVLEDLTPYYEGDEELQNTPFLTNVLDAFRTDGRMYTIVPAFYVMTLIGAKEDVGDPASFTLDRAKSLIQQKGADLSRAFGLVQRDILLYNALELCGESFLNWETASCSFNSEEFISLLEFLEPFPGSMTEGETMVDTTADYRNGTSLFYLTSLGSFDDYVYIRHGMFGKEITMTGFPCDSGAEAAISPQMQIAVSSTAKDKDAAWEFVRRFLQPGYQSSINYYYWPVSEEAIEALAVTAQEPHYFDDGNGNLEIEPVVVSIGGEMIELPVLSHEEAEEVKEFLRSIDHAVYIDSAVENIITEEAEAFFSGQKSAKDVADIIQSRVQIYINENS